LLNFIGETFVNRIGNGEVIGDIADVYGKIIDQTKVLIAAQKILAQQ
jgi:hypothetical protein